MFARIFTTCSGAVGVVMVLGLFTPVSADVALDDDGKFSVYGDFRARIETDWDSRQSSGSDRDDRTRARVRARLGVKFKPNDMISMGVRLRTGSDDSQQSPHITVIDFDDNDTGDAHINLDKWFFELSGAGASVWAGRNSAPFWKQNELLWDDDVTPAGVGVTYRSDVGEGSLGANAGYFAVPVGMQQFSGYVGLGQLVYTTNIDETGLTVAGGLLAFDSDADDGDAGMLLQGNGGRDYTIWTGSVQVKCSVADRPLVLGGDYMHNSEDYSASSSDALTALHRNEVDGFVASLKWGQTKNRGDWLLGYYYAYIETFAVNNSVAQDDWLRWGSATQTRSSNFEGHEIRGALGLGNGMNLVARLYLVDAIEPLTSGASKEDGNRFRLDFNYKF